ncbi:DnaA N-terminal domain-containing protein [Candidatus Sneabacter namystus]|uniref:DnaA N-terminal domain-containing protein n=1 Tax=Candidatus Sneabacter namystus TaxID=2601646 RepID=A0A5C0UJE3_9RICK|nr:DnaA N-terminal domain-containing protein [Candidatus Sneabacter namystus]QEK39897.1 hypothetical protein FZC37_03040 [Candidatus Sneabacter namystus]
MESQNKISGNIIPHEWYKVVTTCGKPDLVAITILGEVFFRHRLDNKKIFHWQVGYRYFEEKFSLSKNQVRSALLRLESLGIVKRQISTAIVNNIKHSGIVTLVFFAQKLSNLVVKNFAQDSRKFSNPLSKISNPDNKSIEYKEDLSEKKDFRLFIDQELLEKINKRTKKAFTLNFASQIIEKLNSVYPEKTFSSLLRMENYLVKVFDGEKNYKHESLTASSTCDIPFDTKVKRQILKDYSSSSIHPLILSCRFIKKENQIHVFVNVKHLSSEQEQTALNVIRNIAPECNVKFLFDKKHCVDINTCSYLGKELMQYFGKNIYSGWFSKLTLDLLTEKKCVLGVSSNFIKDWIDSNYYDTILSCIKNVNKNLHSLEVCVNDNFYDTGSYS